MSRKANNLRLILLLVLSACVANQSNETAPPPALSVSWTPVYQTFDGVEMAQVPAGCFTMGSLEGEADEQPAHQICFDAAFWIDRYEVTNAQYGSAGEWTGENRPRERVTWHEALAHCEARGVRLPTEPEWEYAARGPDSWMYPWGNAFVAENVVYDANSGNQTADVGSRADGASWVGASDMSGNVWEWTSTVYRFYPYDAEDGRESPSETLPRVVRGGSWVGDEDYVRAANRGAFDANSRDANVGFRCARDD